MNLRNMIIKEIQLRKSEIRLLEFKVSCLEKIFDQTDHQTTQQNEEMMKLFLEIIQD